MRIGRKLGWLAAGTAVTALMASGSANAIPTTLLSGKGACLVSTTCFIEVPTLLAPGGNTIETQLDRETLVDSVGDVFFGVGSVSTITDAATTATYGALDLGGGFAFANNTNTGGHFLGGPYQSNPIYASFGGFTVTSVTGTSTTGFTIKLTGGFLDYYLFDAGTAPNLLPTDTQAQQVTKVESGEKWLGFTPDPLDALGNTLILTIPVGGLLSSFVDAGAQALLSVNSGFAPLHPDVETYFNTCETVPATGFYNPFASDSCSDVHFIGHARTAGTPAPWNVNGADQVAARNSDLVPEPGTLALFGFGLLGLGFMVRRNRLV